MTLSDSDEPEIRDLFAALVMAGFAARLGLNVVGGTCSQAAYMAADEMLAERAKERKP